MCVHQALPPPSHAIHPKEGHIAQNHPRDVFLPRIVEHLRSHGVPDIPWGMQIAFPPSDPPVAEIRHPARVRPLTSRFRCDDTSERVPLSDEAALLDCALRHARIMTRRLARQCALSRSGQRPIPHHALEAHPLLAAARRLAVAGLVAIDGDVEVDDDAYMIAPKLEVVAAGRRFVLRQRDGRTHLEIPVDLPHTIVAALAGQPLSSLIVLPSCGDAAIDAAIADLTIEQACMDEDCVIPMVVARLLPAPVVELEPTPGGEDGAWKTMKPRPTL